MNKDIKICFINPPSPFLINPNVFPPLGLLGIATIAQKHEYENIQFIDLSGCKDVKKELYEVKADIFFLTAVTAQVEYCREIVYELRKYNMLSKFVLGGVHATVKIDDCFFVNSIVVGDGEIPTLKILKEYPNLKRIYQGKEIKDLDSIPFVNRNFIDIKQYAKNYQLDGHPTTTYVTSRGCSYGKCSFCCRMSKGVRYRSAQNIFEEVKQVKELYGITGAMFFDDEFVSNRIRLKKFCELLIDSKLNIKWRCLARVTSITTSIVKLMEEAGCVEIAVGVESANEEILENITKGIKIDVAKKAIKIIKENNIKVKELFIVGLPGENKQSIKDMDNFCKETKPDDVDFTILSVFPGSKIYENPNDYDIKFIRDCKSFYKSFGDNYNTVCPISTSQMSFSDIIDARDRLEKKYKPKGKLS